MPFHLCFGRLRKNKFVDTKKIVLDNNRRKHIIKTHR